jgi:hypothetical protein
LVVKEKKGIKLGERNILKRGKEHQHLKERKGAPLVQREEMNNNSLKKGEERQ